MLQFARRVAQRKITNHPQSNLSSNVKKHRTHADSMPGRTRKAVIRPKTHPVIVYVDGACKGNHQRDETLRKSGYGVYFGEGDPRNMCGRVPGRQTNNSGELYAIYRVLHKFKDTEEFLDIYPDSEYAINVINRWMYTWAIKGWKKAGNQPIANEEIVKQLYELCTEMRDRFEFHWVKGHSGNPGNTGADALANLGCTMEPEQFVWNV